MDVGEFAGYRWIIQGQYDTLYRDADPEREARWREASGAYLARVIAALNLPDTGRHLDIGCGSGLSALAVAHARPEMTVVGLDASASAVAVARRAADVEGRRNVTFVQGDAEDPPTGPFDRLSALSVFNLLADKAAALRAWRRVAAPRARLVLTDAFTTTGPGTRGAGASTDAAFTLMARRAGWRFAHREDLTPLMHRLHAKGAWPWPEYVRPSASPVREPDGPRAPVTAGFRYVLHALEAA